MTTTSPRLVKLQAALDAEFGERAPRIRVSDSNSGPVRWLEGDALARIAKPVFDPRQKDRGVFVWLSLADSAEKWVAAARKALADADAAQWAEDLGAAHSRGEHHGAVVPGCPACAEALDAVRTERFLAGYPARSVIASMEAVRKALRRAIEMIDEEEARYRRAPWQDARWHESPAAQAASGVISTVTQQVNNAHLWQLPTDAARADEAARLFRAALDAGEEAPVDDE